MKLTVDHDSHGKIVVRDESGDVKVRVSRYCNPAALAQAVAQAEAIGEIDWENSQVAKPD